MEVRKRLFGLASIVVTMTIVTSADYSVVDLTQLFKAAGKIRKQLTSCSIPYPTTNPCQDGRTQNRFPIDSTSNMFIQCSSQNTMYLTICPPSQPYFNRNLLDCSATDSLARSVGSIASGRTSRRAATCSFQYPTTNPCQQLGRTHDRFPYPSSPDMFIQCSSHNTMYLTICPPTQPYYNQNLLDCATTLSTSASSVDALEQCGQKTNPCTYDNVYILSRHVFGCPNSLARGYLQCDTTEIGAYHIGSCPANEVFSESAQGCVSPVHLTGVAVGAVLITDYAYPCTTQSIASHHYLHPYEGDTQLYIQCNEWGTGYLRSCQPGYFNPLSRTCVDGPIVGRK